MPQARDEWLALATSLEQDRHRLLAAQSGLAGLHGLNGTDRGLTRSPAYAATLAGIEARLSALDAAQNHCLKRAGVTPKEFVRILLSARSMPKKPGTPSLKEAVFRAVQRGASSRMQIAAQCGCAPATATSYLSALKHAGRVRSCSHGRWETEEKR